MRMSRLYKEKLTVQVLFLGAHHFMSGGFADCSRYSGACHAVLSGGDPICECLARHLLRPRLPPPFLRERRGDGPALTRRPYSQSTQALPPAAARRLSSLLSPPWYHLLSQPRAKPRSGDALLGISSKGRSVTNPRRGLPSQDRDTVPGPPRPFSDLLAIGILPAT